MKKALVLLAVAAAGCGNDNNSTDGGADASADFSMSGKSDGQPADLTMPQPDFALPPCKPFADDGGTPAPLAWSSEFPSVQRAALFAAWAVAPDDIYMVGDLGRIAHTTDGGANFTVEQSGTNKKLLGVW